MFDEGLDQGMALLGRDQGDVKIFRKCIHLGGFEPSGRSIAAQYKACLSTSFPQSLATWWWNWLSFPFYPGGYDVCAVNYSSHKSKKEPEPSRMLITTLGVYILDSESCFGASGFCGQSQGSAFFLPFPLASHRTIQRLEHDSDIA